MAFAVRGTPGDPGQQAGRRVPQQDLGRGARPQRQLVAHGHHVPQRPGRLLLGHAHPADVAQHVQVHRLGVPGTELPHQRLGFRRQLPAPAGQLAQRHRPGPAMYRPRWPTAARCAPAYAPAAAPSSWAARWPPPRRGSRGRRVVGEQGQDVQGPTDAADPFGFFGHGAHRLRNFLRVAYRHIRPSDRTLHAIHRVVQLYR